MLDKFLIDDGRHLPRLIPDDDASVAAGTARYRAHCSCGRMPYHAPGDQELALTAHAAHVSSCLKPAKGPTWLPMSVRIALLLAAMFLTVMTAFVAGQIVVHRAEPSGVGAKATLVASQLAGYGLAFALMVAVRRYIAPTRG